MIPVNTIKIITVLLLLNIPLQLFAQTNETGIVKGKITDEKTGSGLVAANVYINNSPNPKEIIGSVTDLSGNFEFEAPTGEYVLKVSYIGYEDYTNQITVEPNDTLAYEISLTSRKMDDVILLPFIPNQPYNTNETGIVKGIVKEENTDNILPGANVFIELNAKEIINTQTGIDGSFEVEFPTGKHILKSTYIGFEEYTKEIVVKPNDTLSLEISLKVFDTSCPWVSSKPYPELRGFWKAKYYKKGSHKIKSSKRKENSGVYFKFTDDNKPGEFSWHNGCQAFPLCFIHIGDGFVELQENMRWPITSICPEKKRDIMLVTFANKMLGSKTEAVIKNNGKVLELVLGDEKMVFRKMLDN